MRGRKPKPTALQIAQGDPRKLGKNKLEEKLAAEPDVKRGLPDCPRYLRGRARHAWGFWAEELAHMNLDAKPDAMMLEGACVAWAKAVEADLILARDGLIVEDSIIDKKSGERIVLKRKRNPADHISNSAWRQVRAFCSEFGLSPTSRTRLSVGKRDTAEMEIAELLSRPREPRQSRDKQDRDPMKPVVN